METVLRWTAWLWVVASAAAAFFVMNTATGEVNPLILASVMALLFLILMVRLVLFARRHKSRRPALIALLVGMILWAAGSVVLQSEQSVSPLVFPAPGEYLFLASFLGFAAFLFLDAAAGRAIPGTAWVDAVILTAGAAALASAVLLTPFVQSFPNAGVGLIVAVLYPLIDILLALLIVGQWALGARPGGRRTIMLAAGFIAFAIADSSLTLSLQEGTYSFALILDALWGVGFLLIVDAAIAPRTSAVGLGRSVPSFFLLAGFLTAIVLLFLRPAGVVGLAVGIPAALALIATGIRLVLALKAAHASTEAFRLAATDDLTGLPNRRALVSRLDAAIAAKTPAGLLLMDLDGFKDINDTLGHAAGDFLLRVAGQRMREVLPASALLARQGGDEFAVVAATEDEIELLEIAAELRSVLAHPVTIDGLDVAVKASVGVTFRSDSDKDAVDLLRRADVAMYEAKSSGGSVQVYDPDRDGFSRQRLQMADDLRRSLSRGEIITWFQPKVQAATGEVCSLEALVRWQHPTEGLISPIVFLPLARREGLMLELSKQVARQAISHLATWRRAGLNLSVAINVAPPELLGGQFLTYLYDLLDIYVVPADAVTIEVTEDSFLADPSRARDILLEIRSRGLKSSIDDYGTGFSSLAYLRDLPVDEVKLDRSFIAAVCADRKSALIVASTVSMAHALDLSVVAEGVESEAIAAKSVSLGVDVLQGYHLSRPLPAESVEEWVRSFALEVPVLPES